MMKPPMLGDQELEVLRYITDHSPISVRDVAVQFGEPLGLARTTILTVMERLRKKGFLTRTKSGGSFEYAPAVGKQDLMQNLVHDFVSRTLGGSLTPFVAYLSENQNLNEEEVADLQKLLDAMQAKKG
ncbi:BlaI/MecI/CopY family transcriptional regulator [Capsulimonas corticalis]|nr:BlaI/MecI/CopY family transcriptional regulator [Capsulimonas corticalis]